MDGVAWGKEVFLALARYPIDSFPEKTERTASAKE
jgi:hypothetical protein